MEVHSAMKQSTELFCNVSEEDFRAACTMSDHAEAGIRADEDFQLVRGSHDDPVLYREEQIVNQPADALHDGSRLEPQRTSSSSLPGSEVKSEEYLVEDINNTVADTA